MSVKSTEGEHQHSCLVYAICIFWFHPKNHSGNNIGKLTSICNRFESVVLSTRVEKKMVTHSSIHVWRITWTKKPGKL